MESTELGKWFDMLRKSYTNHNNIGIVRSLSKMIDFLLEDFNGYPPNVQDGIRFSVSIFCQLRDDAENDKIDNYETDWNTFKAAANDLTDNVFVPWLNSTTSVHMIVNNKIVEA